MGEWQNLVHLVVHQHHNKNTALKPSTGQYLQPLVRPTAHSVSVWVAGASDEDSHRWNRSPQTLKINGMKTGSLLWISYLHTSSISNHVNFRYYKQKICGIRKCLSCECGVSPSEELRC